MQVFFSVVAPLSPISWGNCWCNMVAAYANTKHAQCTQLWWKLIQQREGERERESEKELYNSLGNVHSVVGCCCLAYTLSAQRHDKHGRGFHHSHMHCTSHKIFQHKQMPINSHYYWYIFVNKRFKIDIDLQQKLHAFEWRSNCKLFVESTIYALMQ